jgi:hypothetical protein
MDDWLLLLSSNGSDGMGGANNQEHIPELCCKMYGVDGESPNIVIWLEANLHRISLVFQEAHRCWNAETVAGVCDAVPIVQMQGGLVRLRLSLSLGDWALFVFFLFIRNSNAPLCVSNLLHPRAGNMSNVNFGNGGGLVLLLVFLLYQDYPPPNLLMHIMV